MKKDTKDLLALLRTRHVDLSSLATLEAFGYTGAFRAKYYASLVKTFDVWEIDPARLPALRKNLPAARIRIVDTFEEISRTIHRFDWIILDNPTCRCFGNNGYEHFNLFPNVFRVARDRVLLTVAFFNDILSSRHSPAKCGQAHLTARDEFYGPDSNILDHGRVSKAYGRPAHVWGYKEVWSSVVPITPFRSWFVAQYVQEVS